MGPCFDLSVFCQKPDIWMFLGWRPGSSTYLSSGSSPGNMLEESQWQSKPLLSSALWKSPQNGKDLVQGLLNATLACCWCLIILGFLGVCVCVCVRAHAREVSCVQLCNSLDCSPPGSSIHVIFQARRLEWIAISFSRKGSSRSRDRTCVSCIARQILYP